MIAAVLLIAALVLGGSLIVFLVLGLISGYGKEPKGKNAPRP